MPSKKLCDIHHHIVYGVDDGSQSISESLKMLKKAASQGVSVIVCSSHISPGRHHYDSEAYLSHLEELKEKAGKVTLLPGSEILYTTQTTSLLQSGQVPTLNNTSNVLVEFRPDTPFHMIKSAVLDLNAAGYTPVIAHVERYDCLRERGMLERLRNDLGAMTQMNASTVISSGRLLGSRWVKTALRNNLIDIVASDAHSHTGRSCCLGDAYKILEQKYGKNCAELLCCTNPRTVAGLMGAHSDR